MKERLAKLNMSLPEAHIASGTERLATVEELAEIGGAPSDPLTEEQILALLEVQMKEDLKQAAAESAAQAREAAMQELAAARQPELADSQEKSARVETVKAAAQPAPVGKMPANAAGILSEPERVAAAFFGAEEETSVQTPPEVQAAVEVQPLVKTQTQAPAQAEILSEPAVEGHAEIAAVPREEARDLKTELLEVAEALDQHRLWVESNGREGIRGDFAGANLSDADLTAVNLQGADLTKVNLRGADLSMANLRGANLVEADLRETNLLGAEFSGANMMGANLYGAQGLWAGRLGGTNLFD